MGKRVSRPVRPERLHGAVALALALLGTAGLLWLMRGRLTWYHVLGAWLAAVNGVTLGYYAFDKRRARRGGRRVPEAVLHGLALAGGSPGAWLAMRLFRHKTVKGQFRFLFWCIVTAQLALAAWVGYYLWRHRA